MSSALVRKGLELLNADLTEGLEGKKKKKNVIKNSGSKKKSSRAAPVGHSRSSAKEHKVKSILEEASMGQKKDNTAVNLQYFLSSSSSASADHTTKIVRQNSGRCARSSVAQSVRKPQESQSVFTEEEFQQFQKEYFGAVMETQ